MKKVIELSGKVKTLKNLHYNDGGSFEKRTITVLNDLMELICDYDSNSIISDLVQIVDTSEFDTLTIGSDDTMRNISIDGPYVLLGDDEEEKGQFFTVFVYGPAKPYAADDSIHVSFSIKDDFKSRKEAIEAGIALWEELNESDWQYEGSDWNEEHSERISKILHFGVHRDAYDREIFECGCVEMSNGIKDLCDDIANRHPEIMKAKDFTCPYMRNLAELISWRKVTISDIIGEL